MRILWAAQLLFVTALVGCGERQATPTETHNVLLISIDTLRRDHLGSYGYPRPTSPNLDRLAAESLRFDRAIAVSNWTLPTHASMLTGLYPESHGAHAVASDEPHVRGPSPAAALCDDCPTLAVLLAERGLRTGAVLANFWWLGERYGFDRGFESFDHRQGRRPIIYRRAQEITDAAIAWLDEPDARPFFLFLNYMDPHIPYAPPPPFDTRFGNAGSEEPEASWGAFAELQREASRQGELPEATRARWIDRYDGEIAYVDHEIGRLIDWLRQRGWWERTLVVVTSDHGEAFGEHGVAGHGLTLYEPELAVPLLLRVPGTGATGTSQALAQHVDILPTVLEGLGLPVPVGIHGFSLTSGERRRARAVEQVREANAKLSPRFTRLQRALYEGDLKLIEYSDGSRELFDLGSHTPDLDVSSLRPADADRLQEALTGWTLLQARRDRSPGAGEPVDPETVERLRALGYAPN